jgi:hypothetical protein
MAARHLQSTARWPFWVLLAAWICANSPQVAVYAVVTWVAEARTFSHQHELTRAVAHILKKEAAPSRVAFLVRQASADRPVRPWPSIPNDAVLRKVELALQLCDGPVWQAEGVQRFVLARVVVPESLRSAPPLGPPRAGAV